MFSLKSRKWTDNPKTREVREDIGYDLEYFIKFLWPAKLCEVQEEFPLSKGPLSATASKLESKLAADLDDINNMVSESKSEIEIGNSFNIMSLLSFNGNSNYLVRNNGDRVVLNEDTFKGKDIMVCCFYVPILYQSGDTLEYQSLATICYEKYDLRENDFEMVVVVQMSSVANYGRVFDHFLSAFPPQCLVVPFNDPKRRDYIWYYLEVRNCCKCFIVDRSGIVLLNEYPNFALGYGAEAFPFTASRLHEIRAKDIPLWKTPSTTQLEQLLGCTASDVLYKINGREEVSISTLKEKVVGLYLLYDGYYTYTDRSFIFILNDVHKECKAQQLDFEVVVAYIPFGVCIDPEDFQSNVDQTLKDNNISSWWRMPFNNSKCRRLCRINQYFDDNLIIVGPHNKFVDPYGKEVLINYGAAGYPFTRESLVRSQVRQLRAFTLESLLVYESRNYVLRRGSPVAVAELQPSSIVVYYASFACFPDYKLYGELQAWYQEIKAKHPDFEVVFVRKANMDLDSDEEYNKAFDELLSRHNWFICPFNSEHSASLEKKLFVKCAPYDTLIGFGIDGHVCSIQAEELLRVVGSDGFPLKDNLHEEVFSRLDNIHPYLNMQHMT